MITSDRDRGGTIYLKVIEQWHNMAAQDVECVDCGYEGRLLCSKCLEERIRRFEDTKPEMDPDEY